MFSFFKSSTLFSLLAFSASVAFAASNTPQAQPIAVTTPHGLTECKNYNLTWHHGKHPYVVSIYKGCDEDSTDDTAIFTVDNIQSSWLGWNVNLGNGSSVMFAVQGSDGSTAYSDDVTIAKGDPGCVGQPPVWKVPTQDNSGSNSISIGGSPPTTANPTQTNPGIANVASNGPNKPKTGGASTLKASGALAALVAAVAVVASS